MNWNVSTFVFFIFITKPHRQPLAWHVSYSASGVSQSHLREDHFQKVSYLFVHIFALISTVILSHTHRQSFESQNNQPTINSSETSSALPACFERWLQSLEQFIVFRPSQWKICLAALVTLAPTASFSIITLQGFRVASCCLTDCLLSSNNPSHACACIRAEGWCFLRSCVVILFR